jgi:hypothetical protein
MNWWHARFWKHPLRIILLVALGLRMLAAWFSEGYLMHDDHFLVVEAAASWVDGEDYNNWFPWSQNEAGISPVAPHPANFAYVGTQYLTIWGIKSLGISDPKTIALWLRILHGFYSLAVVFFTYRIALKIGGASAAWASGWAMAALAIMPVLSVHQLVEMACIPPLLFAFERSLWGRGTWQKWVAMGLGFGLATGLRFQCGLIAVGWAVGHLLENRGQKSAWLEATAVGALSLLTFALAQIQDLFIWGRPFVQLMAYFGYNTTHALNYPQGPPGQYLLTLIGLMIPPLSLAILWGFGHQARRWPSIAFAVLAFYLFHELYPNKQERFILPVLPLVVALGTTGWQAHRAKSGFWQRHCRLHRGLLAFVLFVNGVALVVLSVGTVKSSRVNAMYALWQAGDLQNFMAIHVDSSPQAPAFYSGSWEKYYVSTAEQDPAQRLDLVCRLREKRTFPNYLLFYGDAHLGETVLRYKEAWPGLAYVGQIPPGRLDRFIHWLNPLNSVERVMIYRVDPEVACAAIN